MRIREITGDTDTHKHQQISHVFTGSSWMCLCCSRNVILNRSLARCAYLLESNKHITLLLSNSWRCSIRWVVYRHLVCSLPKPSVIQISLICAGFEIVLLKINFKPFYMDSIKKPILHLSHVSKWIAETLQDVDRSQKCSTIQRLKKTNRFYMQL